MHSVYKIINQRWGAKVILILAMLRRIQVYSQAKRGYL